MYLNVTAIPERGVYRLITSVIIDGVHIKDGFEWNGASIPAPLWMIIGSPFEPRFMAPSMVHDYLYSHGRSLGWVRKHVDKLFKKLLIAEGVDEERAETMYFAVRAAGKPFWVDK